MTSTPTKRQRDAKVCTECRQSKVRCNASETHPRPCSRCDTRGIPCKIDPNFKRTPARQRAKAIESELNRLKEERVYAELSNSNYAASATSLRTLGASPEDQNDPFVFGIDASQPNTLQLSLETVGLGTTFITAYEVQDKFTVFAEKFHPHFPVVNTKTNAGDLYRNSPLLFWTIIVISCRIRPLLAGDQADFDASYIVLLKDVAMEIPLTLHSIQALLLISIWPLPQHSQLLDPSWSYSNLAMSGCGYLNLSRSTNKLIYQGGQVSHVDLSNMSRTWLATFISLTTQAVDLGYPPPIKDAAELSQIEMIAMQGMMPQRLAVWTSIMSVVARYNGMASPSVGIATLEAMVDTAVRTVDAIEARHQGDGWDKFLAFHAAQAKLQLYTTSVVRSSAHNYKHSLAQDGQGHILLATQEAQLVISLFGVLVGEAPAATKDEIYQNFWSLPKVNFRGLLQAANFLIRFSCFNETLTETIRSRGQEHARTAIETLHRISARPGGMAMRDEPGRAVLVLELLMKHGHTFNDMAIDDRSSSSVFWDSIHQSYRLRGIRTHRTDLLTLIDPTRKDGYGKDDLSDGVDRTYNAKLENNKSDSLTQTATPASSTEIWHDPFMEFFDFTWLDNSVPVDWQALPAVNVT